MSKAALGLRKQSRDFSDLKIERIRTNGTPFTGTP